MQGWLKIRMNWIYLTHGDVIHHINIPKVKPPIITSHSCPKPPDKIQHTLVIKTQIGIYNLFLGMIAHTTRPMAKKQF